MSQRSVRRLDGQCGRRWGGDAAVLLAAVQYCSFVSLPFVSQLVVMRYVAQTWCVFVKLHWFMYSLIPEYMKYGKTCIKQLFMHVLPYFMNSLIS